MALPKLYTVVGAVVAVIVVGVGGFFVLQPPADLLSNAVFSDTILTPNADGEGDIVVFSYTLSRNAIISLSFENENGQQFVFRDQQRRAPGDYSVNFSGVVDGYIVDSDPDIAGTIERRLIPDGTYQWFFEVVDDEGETATQSGTLLVQAGDSQLPWMRAFEVFPLQFSPNQDGVNDRISVNVFLEKAADLTVYLQDENGVRIYLPERNVDRDPGEPGNHEFDYDGGVDDGFEPPENGPYTLFAVAQDDEGQRVVLTEEINIVSGGLPQVEIAPQPSGSSVCFSTLPWDDRYYNTDQLEGDLIELPRGGCSDLTTITMLQGDLLVFWLTVRNYGEAPVRTNGPFAGRVYDYDQLPPALGFAENDGAVRVGIHCQANVTDHPWRWGLGQTDALLYLAEGEDGLVPVERPDAESTTTPENQQGTESIGEAFYYLDAGQSLEVWGAIRMTTILEERRSQSCYASLIHEGVRVFNRQVGARQIELLPRELEQ